jgi:hypothetical protein
MKLMKIKCIKIKKESPGPTDSTYEFLEMGKEYNVYGMMIKDGEVFYYICDRVHLFFPVARPFHLFEIIDSRLSRYWIFGIIEGFKKHPVWIFPEWVNEPYFQDSLTDLEKREVAIFKSYKELMDLEFPDSFVSETAQIIDNEWLMCSSCLEAWKSSSDVNALAKCPKCHKTLNNPLYKNEYPHL